MNREAQHVNMNYQAQQYLAKLKHEKYNNFGWNIGLIFRGLLFNFQNSLQKYIVWPLYLEDNLLRMMLKGLRGRQTVITGLLGGHGSCLGPHPLFVVGPVLAVAGVGFCLGRVLDVRVVQQVLTFCKYKFDSTKLQQCSDERAREVTGRRDREEARERGERERVQKKKTQISKKCCVDSTVLC